ncbi:MAG: chromosome segregation protein SMC [Armatimonadota bacterium]|nr:chromosome segregation protein SMC [Armatimonadota bacterium]
MLLKKLEIQGFKSFADRTEILFTPGVIAVVGPNGSGKSNISDAILWVLGEQNVRALRGQKYEDVIFAGTDKRRPVGMAEVSLTVDNSSGKLPIDFSEVTVTRRAYRSGESEFFINKTPCRLKDIYELFLDTGLGRGAYSIVSQGEIDAILSARPEDRRELFDEAAGIKKYRHRKKEAERKLETTEQNLQRVNDIIREIETQIEPLAEQAEVAKRYLELVSRLQEIEIGILIHDLRRYNSEIQKVREEKQTVTKAISDSDALLSALEEEKSALAVDLANAEAQVERYQAQYQEALTHLERTESQLALVNQKHTAAENAKSLLSEEIAQLERRVKQLESQRRELLDELEGLEKEETELNRRIATKTAELRTLQEKLDSAARETDEQKSNYIELAKKLAAQKTELANTLSRIETLQATLDRLSVEHKDIEQALSKAQVEKETAEVELSKIRADLNSVAKEMSALSIQIKERQMDITIEENKLNEVSHALVDKQSRLKTLCEMEEAREGYFLGVRSVMSAVKNGLLNGNFAVVADIIKVPEGYETAFEVALGSSLQDIITDSDNEAKEAIEYLKEKKAGRATFLPLNMMRHTVSPLLKELVGKNGIIGIGNELVKFDKKYTPAINSLLGKVLIAKDIDCAIAVSKSAIGWSKIVTLEGELVLPSGAITGGNNPGKSTNLLGRKRVIEVLKREISEAENKLAAIDASIQNSRREVNELSDRLAALGEQDTALKMSLLEKERQIDFMSRELERLNKELDAINLEREDVGESLQRAQEAQALLASAIEAADKENSNLDELINKTEQEVIELQEKYDLVSNEISSANISLASLVQKKVAIERSLEVSENTSKELIAEGFRKREQLAKSVDESCETEQKSSELELELEKAKKICDETQTQSEQWRKTKQTILASSMEVAERIREVSRNREELVQKIHAAELREARLEVQIAQTTARLLDEYDVTVEEALRKEIPEPKHGSATEVMRLRREIKAMGEVNTGAVQEYARLKERLEFLSNQRQDLLDARRKLTDAIKEIDESTRGVFIETFEEVGKAFNEMFSRLFGGGKTQLVLTDPENILESGIDVMVEMPGKKRQNLLLLSGGERALTASALIFALMSVKPSPFCVLDEVDASLDEANVERFADIIREFANNSQMIVITHNRATMEVADVLYGVTMQEPGISKIISVKISDIAEKN